MCLSICFCSGEVCGAESWVTQNWELGSQTVLLLRAQSLYDGQCFLWYREVDFCSPLTPVYSSLCASPEDSEDIVGSLPILLLPCGRVSPSTGSPWLWGGSSGICLCQLIKRMFLSSHVWKPTKVLKCAWKEGPCSFLSGKKTQWWGNQACSSCVRLEQADRCKCSEFTVTGVWQQFKGCWSRCVVWLVIADL